MAIDAPRRGLFGRLLGFLDAFRRLVVNAIFLILLVLVLVALFSGEGEKPLEPETVLLVAPRGDVVEESQVPDLFSEILDFADAPAQTELSSITDALRAAATDERITAAVLDFGELGRVPLGMAHAFADAIDTFRDSGKPVIAVADFYTQADYFLAAHADEVYLHPFGQVVLTGYGSHQLYLGETLERFGVTVNVFRAGTYKSATEPLTRGDMSDEARENARTLIDGFWSYFRERVAERRGLDPATLDRLADDLPEALASTDGDAARLALEHELVDELLERNQLDDRIRESTGAPAAAGTADGEGPGYRAVDFREYTRRARARQRTGSGPAVALIHAEGTILDGEQPPGTIGAEDLVQRIRRARENPDVAALVLRLNSPGGSAFASELIRRELELTQVAGKPVVVSMSGVAASGGYWIASTADAIVAAPVTVTGSIGVFSVFPTLEEAIDRLDASVDGVATHALARPLSPLAPLPAVAAQVLQQSVDNVYDRFLQRVAAGRDMSVEAVDEIGQGRVWSGTDALERGLVDALGNTEEALRLAAERAGVTDWRVLRVDRPLDPRQAFLRQLTEMMEGRALAGWAKALVPEAAIAPYRPLGTALRQEPATRWLETLQNGARRRAPADATAFCMACLVVP